MGPHQGNRRRLGGRALSPGRRQRNPAAAVYDAKLQLV